MREKKGGVRNATSVDLLNGKKLEQKKWRRGQSKTRVSTREVRVVCNTFKQKHQWAVMYVCLDL